MYLYSKMGALFARLFRKVQREIPEEYGGDPHHYGGGKRQTRTRTRKAMHSQKSKDRTRSRSKSKSRRNLRYDLVAQE